MTFFASFFIAMLRTTNLFFVYKNKNYCYLCRFYHECAFDLLIWLISSSVSIGSLNKHILARMLLTACNCYQLWRSTSRHAQNVPLVKKKCGKNARSHLRKVNSLDIIWSSFSFLTVNKFLKKPVLVINIYFTCSGTSLLLFLTCCKG